MPTPHGTRGGIAFSADEVRVLRRALTEVLSPVRGAPVAELPTPAARRRAKVVAPRPADHLRDCRRLAAALDAAVQEAGRLRVFLLAEPGRTAPPRHRDTLVDNDVRQRLEAHMPAPRRLPTLPGRPQCPVCPDAPALADEPEHKPKPGPKPTPGPVAPKPQQKPAPRAPQQEPEPAPKAPEPGKEPEKEPEQPPRRRTPTPAEIWPPRRRERKPDQGRSAALAQGWLL